MPTRKDGISAIDASGDVERRTTEARTSRPRRVSSTKSSEHWVRLWLLLLGVLWLPERACRAEGCNVTINDSLKGRVYKVVIKGLTTTGPERGGLAKGRGLLLLLLVLLGLAPGRLHGAGAKHRHREGGSSGVVVLVVVDASVGLSGASPCPCVAVQAESETRSRLDRP